MEENKNILTDQEEQVSSESIDEQQENQTTQEHATQGEEESTGGAQGDRIKQLEAELVATKKQKEELEITISIVNLFEKTSWIS